MHKYSLLELKALKAPELWAIGRSMTPPVKIGKQTNKATCIERILTAQARNDIAERIQTNNSKEKESSLPQNTDLEKKLDGVVPLDSSKDDKRGGKRDGAGRPKGTTDKIARLQRAMDNETPNPAVKATLEALFEAWAARVKVTQVKLTKQEAFDLALPYTNLLKYFNVEKFIPDWYLLGVTVIWNTKAIMSAKIEIIKEKRPDLKQDKKGKEKVPVKEPAPRKETIEDSKPDTYVESEKSPINPQFVSQASLFGKG